MRATVYGIPGSHPVRAGLLMLDRKGIEWRRRDLPNGVSRLVLRALGFPDVTVPAVRVDGRKVQTTRALARALDEIVPEPPLFPADPDRRAAVESAEQWGDEVLQPVPRRLSWAALSRDRKPLRSFLEGPVMGIPPSLAALTGGPLVKVGVRLNGAHDDAVRADLLTLPVLLDQVDDLIANGVVGAAEPNAADFQILTSVRLLMCFDDLRPLLDGRPVAEAALRVVPDYAGHVPPVFPAEWLPVLAPAPS
jgi:glutathione S-transferase